MIRGVIQIWVSVTENFLVVRNRRTFSRCGSDLTKSSSHVKSLFFLALKSLICVIFIRVLGIGGVCNLLGHVCDRNCSAIHRAFLFLNYMILDVYRLNTICISRFLCFCKNRTCQIVVFGIWICLNLGGNYTICVWIFLYNFFAIKRRL